MKTDAVQTRPMTVGPFPGITLDRLAMLRKERDDTDTDDRANGHQEGLSWALTEASLYSLRQLRPDARDDTPADPYELMCAMGQDSYLTVDEFVEQVLGVCDCCGGEVGGSPAYYKGFLDGAWLGKEEIEERL